MKKNARTALSCEKSIRTLCVVHCQISLNERTIIELYYGLQDEEPRTLKEIGEVFGITRERVRQIKEHAINKLRQSLHVRASFKNVDRQSWQRLQMSRTG